jgi:hypothetical protein
VDEETGGASSGTPEGTAEEEHGTLRSTVPEDRGEKKNEKTKEPLGKN